MEQKKIDRINELARKVKSGIELSEDERRERTLLRREYLEAVRRNFKSQLDNIEIIDKRRTH